MTKTFDDTTESELREKIRKILERTDHIFVFAANHGMEWHGGDLTEEITQVALADREAAVKEAKLEAIDSVFEMSPKSTFDKWKPKDVSDFYQRLRAYEREVLQSNLTNTKEG